MRSEDIREGVRSRLLNKTAAADRVYSARGPAVADGKLPAITVEVPAKEGSSTSISIPRFTTSRTIHVGIAAPAYTTDADEASRAIVEDIADEVLDLLMGDATWVRLWSRVTKFSVDCEQVKDSKKTINMGAVLLEVELQEWWDPVQVVGDDAARLEGIDATIQTGTTPAKSFDGVVEYPEED
jgi:hypothetical protein